MQARAQTSPDGALPARIGTTRAVLSARQRFQGVRRQILSFLVALADRSASPEALVGRAMEGGSQGFSSCYTRFLMSIIKLWPRTARARRARAVLSARLPFQCV